MYNYTKENFFEKVAECKIGNVIDVTYVEISREGSRIAILLPEPTNALKILEFSKQEEGVKFREILSIPMSLSEFKELKFNPMNKNFIFLLTKSQYQLIEIIDSFNEDYQFDDMSKEQMTQNLEDFKLIEEEKIIRQCPFPICLLFLG